MSRSIQSLHGGPAALGMLLVGSLLPAQSSQPQTETQPVPRTKVVLLGTGTPAPSPDRSGPATAIVVNNTAYLVDLGPGVVRRASAAAAKTGITALQPTNLRVGFLTHLHSDHTVGYADLILTPWTVGRRLPLDVYGPTGIQAMTEHLLEAYRVDIETRTNADGNQRTFSEGHKVNAHQVAAGVVYKDANVTVTAFPTKHAMESYGYRFETADRSIVISGDTNPTQATIDACRGCDVLIHELTRPRGWRRGPRPETRRQVRFDVLRRSTTRRPGNWPSLRDGPDRLLVLYQYNSLSPEELLADMRSRYAGQFVIGRDLDVY